MRKKIVLFSSILATLPAVLAAEPGSIEASVTKVFTALPIEVWNPILAFVLVSAIINGALSLTNLGKEGGDRRGFGLIAGSLGAIFSIFVATTGFNLFAFILPYLFLILLLFMFSIVSVFITPRDDKRNEMRSQGAALIITGALLLGINGTITDFTETLKEIKIAGISGTFEGTGLTDILSMLTPYTTLLAIIFIVWGLTKVVSSFSGDEDNPSVWGGLGKMVNPRSGRTRSTVTPKASIAAPGTVATGTAATFTASVTGGTGPYNYAWTFTEPGRGSPHTTGVGQSLPHTFTNAGTAKITLKVTDATGKTSKSVDKDITVTAGPTALDVTLEVNSTIPAAVISPGPATVPGQPIDFTATATGGTPPYTYTWTFGTPPPPPAPPPPGATTLAGPTTYNADYSAHALAGMPPFNVTINVTDGAGATESETFDLTVT